MPMMRASHLVVWLLIVIAGGALVGWNATRFVGTTPQPRTKNLDFLPAPAVAAAMSLGQGPALAKLRWIDSFAYLQLQFDRKDDRVAGDGRGGFERLYETLIALDPYFQPFYEHAVLTTGGVLSDHRAALSLLQRGLMHQPDNVWMWRMASAELAISFGWAKGNAAVFDRWLRAWELAMGPEEVGAVTAWRRGLAFVHVDGLETLPYWLEQLRAAQPGTAMGDFVESTVRELLAIHGERVLAQVADGAAREGDRLPRRLPCWAAVRLDPAAVRRQWPRQPPAWAPVALDEHGVPRLRSDPFGYDYRWQGQRIVSPGADRQRFLTRANPARERVRAEADRRGRPPADLAEAAAWGIELPAPPLGGTWEFTERLPDVRWPAPPHPPWELR
jgi:hypothetical protein